MCVQCTSAVCGGEAAYTVQMGSTSGTYTDICLQVCSHLQEKQCEIR